MASYLSQFHYVASQSPAEFDFEKPGFDIKEIYQHFALKVIYKNNNVAWAHPRESFHGQDVQPVITGS
jgi:hypothetical protein